jgi:hypothetical protein
MNFTMKRNSLVIISAIGILAAMIAITPVFMTTVYALLAEERGQEANVRGQEANVRGQMADALGQMADALGQVLGRPTPPPEPLS